MGYLLKTLTTVLCVAVPVLATAETDVHIESLAIKDPAPSADLNGPYTMIELAIERPGLVGLADSARVHRATDDAGRDLLAGEGPFDRDYEASGYFMRHQTTANMEEGWIRLPVFLPDMPHRDATRLEIGMALDVLVRDDGVRTVQVEGVDFSHVPGWGVDVDVEGARMTCRDDRRERPEDQPLELNCVLREGSLLEVSVRNGGAAPEPTHPDANLVIAGARDAVDLEVSLPRTRVEQIPVTLAFGLGLQSHRD